MTNVCHLLVVLTIHKMARTLLFVTNCCYNRTPRRVLHEWSWQRKSNVAISSCLCPANLGGGYVLTTHTNACKTLNVNLVKSTFNLTLTLTLTLTQNLIPHKNNHKWACVREWLASSHCCQVIDLFLCNQQLNMVVGKICIVYIKFWKYNLVLMFHCYFGGV